MKKPLTECICGSKNIVREENQNDVMKFRTANKTKNIHLSGLSWTKCLDCGEIYFNPQECEIYDQKINETLANERRKKGLLTGEEIKEIRESLGYSQDKLDKFLGLGAKSFARWETYRAEQTRAADLLLRAIKKGGKEFLESLINEQKPKNKAA